MSKLQGVLGLRTVGAGFGLAALVALGVSGVSCGSSSSPAPANTTDSSTQNDTPGNDTPGGDTKKPDIGEVGADGGKIDIPSTLLQGGKYYLLDDNTSTGLGTITSDGYVLVLDAGATPNALVAIALDGSGTPIKVVDKADYVYVSGKMAFVYSNVNTTTFIGTLGVWSKAGGYKELSTAARAGQFAVSVDGKVIAYTAKENTKITDIVVDAPTGGAAKTIYTATQNDTKCSPFIAGTATKIAVLTCDAPVTGDAGVDAGVDAGTAPASTTLKVFDASGTGTLVAGSLKDTLSVDKTGTLLFTISTTDAAVVYPEAAGAPTPIDTTVSFGRILNDGKKALYSKAAAGAAGPLYTADVSATPSPVEITTDKVAVFFNPPTGAKYVEYGTIYDNKTSESDLYLAPVSGGTKITLSTDPASAVFGDPYTADGTMAIYYANVSASGNALVGDLTVLDLGAAGAKGVKIAGSVWVSYGPKGKTVAYNDNWLSGGAGTEGTADLKVVDAANPTSSVKLIAPQAENNFYITGDKTKIIFATNDPSFSKPGLYAATIP